MTSATLLYHYTTADGLIGIASTKSLWATSAFYLNDSGEILSGIRTAQEQLQSLREEKGSQDLEQAARAEWLSNQLRNVGTEFSSMPVFVCSLSAERDLLSQWRAYCRGGGFAVGFPAEPLRERATTQGFALEQCVYCKEEQNRLISEVIESVAGDWIRRSDQRLADDTTRFGVSNSLIWEVFRAAARFKNMSFSAERESRLVSVPEWRYAPDKVHFRAARGLVIPYTVFDLPDDRGFWSHVHVVIGPTPHPVAAKAGVYDLFRRFCGHATGISTTSTSYREW